MKLRSYLAIFLLTAAAHAEPTAPASGGPIEVNGIAAKVNGRVVTKNQVSFMLAPFYAQLATQFPRRGPEFEKRLKEGRDKVMNELIDREIILDEFKVIGATLKPQFIDDEISRQIREQYNNDRGRFSEELKKNRLTMDGYREMTREKLVVQAMRAQHFSDAPPPLPNEIQKAYEEIKPTIRDISKDTISFQMIFIPATDSKDPTITPQVQLAVTEELYGKIQGGADFGELAKANSKDSFAEKGGVRENVPRTDLSPAFSGILFEAEPGKAIGPLQDPQGFSIVKVISKVLGPSPPLSDPKVREMVEERVRRKKTEGEYNKWIESKRKHAMIERRI